MNGRVESLSSSLGMYWSTKGESPARTGNRHGGLAESPYNVYPTSDGFIAIICVGETEAQRDSGETAFTITVKLARAYRHPPWWCWQAQEQTQRQRGEPREGFQI